jgi:hypothetical protein
VKETKEKREQATLVELWSRGPQPPPHAGVYENHHARADKVQGSASARIIERPVHCAKVFSGVRVEDHARPKWDGRGSQAAELRISSK